MPHSLQDPLPARSLGVLVHRLRIATPQWRDGLPAALERAKARLNHAALDGVDGYWPATEDVGALRNRRSNHVLLLAPFNPIVWDRLRFELFWGWAYRFEAYTPPSKRKLGYYAMPLLWRERVIGWGNVRVEDGRLAADIGFVAGRAPKDALFKRDLADELARLRTFLAVR